MTPIEQQVHDAFADLDGLLSEGVPIDRAVEEAALGNGLGRDVLRARIERHLGDLEVYQKRFQLRASAVSRESKARQRETKIRNAAAAAAEHTYYACELNDPEHAGRPSWPHAFAGFLDRLQLTDSDLRGAAGDSYLQAVQDLDRKHGTHTSHYHY